jgi:hypothetical protein
MQADRIAALAWRCTGFDAPCAVIALRQRTAVRACKCVRKTIDSLGGDDVACARAPLRQNKQQTRDSLDAIAWCDNAEVDCSCFVAADGKPQHHLTIVQLRAQADIGGNARKIKRSAAVDHDGNFGIETTAERLLRYGAAQYGGECACVEDFRSIKSGERIAQDWHAILASDAERGNGIGKPPR